MANLWFRYLSAGNTELAMTVLVTGSAGFIGHHITKRLMLEGHEVIGIDSLNSYYDPRLKLDRNGALKEVKGNFTFYQMDLVNNQDLNQLFEKYAFDCVIHMAAQAGVRYSIEHPRAYMLSNMEGYFNLLELVRKYQIKHLIYASSSSVYGDNTPQPFQESADCNNPVSFYAATKRSNELMAASYSSLYALTITGLRFFTVYGPWGRPDMAPILFANAAKDKEGIKVFNHGNQKRDFTYIDDIVENIYRLIDNELRLNEGGHQLLNIGRGEPVGLMPFIESIEKAYGVELQKEMVEAQPGDVAVTFADTRKLTSYTEFSPQVSLDEGVKRFITWHKEYYA